jgi:plasmid stability protein
MSNLTLNLDEEVLRRARIRALEQGTSVNALVREWLERYADAGRQRDTTQDIVDLLSTGGANRGSDSWRWNREDVYDDRLNRHGA